jgi:hypothetical protein
MSNSPASWFETHASGALLTTRKKDLILRSALARVSKDGPRVTPPHSRGAIRPGFAQAVPSEIRGRRECRARRAHPQPRVQSKKAHELVTAGRRFARHSPRNGFNGFLRALPGDRAVCHRRQRSCLRQLDASIGASGPHDFAVRSARVRLVAPKRPPHPAPNVL